METDRAVPSALSIKRCTGRVLLLPALGRAADAIETSNDQTRRLIQQSMKERRIPGLQIAVIKNGRVVWKC